jgi:hypothetical protein
MDNSSSAEIEIFLKKQTFQMWQRYTKVTILKIWQKNYKMSNAREFARPPGGGGIKW